MATAESDFLALPQSIERIEFFGPQPPPGATVATTVRIGEVGPRTVRADIELVRNGSVIVRITGWVDRRFDSDPPLWRMLREPEHHLLATPAAGGYVAVEERWGDSASRELLARRYLDASERQVYEALNPRDQRLWLLGRIAAKDAVRHALWSRGHGPMFPIEVPLVDGGSHSVRVCGGPADGIRVAVDQAAWIGVASIGAGTIHVERVEAEDRSRARSNLDRRISASAAGSPVGTDLLHSPVHRSADPPNDGSNVTGRSGQAVVPEEPSDRREYAIAWTQPDR
jgi:hypothetical protein